MRTGGRIVKTSAGYNLTSLFVGSEGTLGVITELTLRVHGIPEHTVAARAGFPDIDAACLAASTAIAGGIIFNRCELMDAFSISAVNAHFGTSFTEAPSLFVEFAGNVASVEADTEAMQSLFADHGCSQIETEVSAEGRSRLWLARHRVGEAILATAPGKIKKSTDVTVPVSRVAEAVRWTREELTRVGLRAAQLGHVGDGNYHTVFMVDPDRPEELAQAKRIEAEQIRHALSVGGTCSGEHGIGIGKIAYLELEHGDSIPLMRGIKHVVDPNGILNPGKVFTA
jgi:D-lactate dehydrogenase (cytochrome)